MPSVIVEAAATVARLLEAPRTNTVISLFSICMVHAEDYGKNAVESATVVLSVLGHRPQSDDFGCSLVVFTIEQRGALAVAGTDDTCTAARIALLGRCRYSSPWPLALLFMLRARHDYSTIPHHLY